MTESHRDTVQNYIPQQCVRLTGMSLTFFFCLCSVLNHMIQETNSYTQFWGIYLAVLHYPIPIKSPGVKVSAYLFSFNYSVSTSQKTE